MPIRIPLAFFCLILSTSAALAQDKKLEPFNFAYASVTGNRTPLWVGRDNGIFEKYGLDLKMVQIGAGSVIVSALLAGEVHRCLVAARAGEQGITRIIHRRGRRDHRGFVNKSFGSVRVSVEWISDC